jgi:pyruvate/2-oxoglutarate dehydrogenase complex dihydrolipoamide acyltransferase (E2) component
MKIRITEPVMLGGGVAAKPGDVVEVGEVVAWAIVSVGRGEELKPEAAEAGTPNATSTVEIREPAAETRDPATAKRGNRRE